MFCTPGRGFLPKVALLEEFFDPRGEFLGDLHGKVEKNWFLNIDLTDTSQYPHMDIHTFMD
jgi:hypothetical protein